MLNRMPAKSLRQQAFAPRSGSFLGCKADKKARHCSGCRKSPDFFDSLEADPQGSALFFEKLVIFFTFFVAIKEAVCYNLDDLK